LAHRGRGQPSNRRIAEPVKMKVLTVYAQAYGDFGPTLAAEKLAERHGITLSDETLRRWLRAVGVVHFQRRKRPHRAWRALGELGVELIPAHSPQAKGRVERLFQTFQDRLVKELRLAGVATLDAANRFLERYLPIYNQRLMVLPAQATDLHRPRPAGGELARILCLQTTRSLRKDWTVAHHGHLYQVRTNVRTPHVLVEERLDGTRRLTHKGRALASHAITARPVKAAEPPRPGVARRRVTPAADHPWRTRLLPDRRPHAAAGLT
jgi:hypothetical protein